MATIDVNVRRMSDLVELARAEIQGANIADIWSAGDAIYARAYATCPVDTGRLRASLTIERRANGVALYSDVYYGQYHPRPFVEGIQAGLDYLARKGYR